MDPRLQECPCLLRGFFGNGREGPALCILPRGTDDALTGGRDVLTAALRHRSPSRHLGLRDCDSLALCDTPHARSVGPSRDLERGECGRPGSGPLP